MGANPKRLSALVFVLAMMWSATAFAQLQGFGVVLMHGKDGTPSDVSGVASALQAKGAIVVTPEMPWSRRRIYDQTWRGTMGEIAAAVQSLKAQGATRIVVGGHSMGANAAMSYGHGSKLAGIIALAPGHVPEGEEFRRTTKDSLDQAKKMVAAGQGDAVGTFMDSNQGRVSAVKATARVYLDLFSPDGPANMHKSYAGVGSTPLFLAESADKPEIAGAYARAAQNKKKSQLLLVNAGHTGVPNAAASAVAAWMQTL